MPSDRPSCAECERAVNIDGYSGAVAERMAAEDVCFSCAFWRNLLDAARERPEDVVRIDGRHYTIEPDVPDARDAGVLAGFGGERFWIVIGDRHVITCNLWAQGEIPQHFRERLPDNARFKCTSF